jgi:predicted nucleic acid-binding protein
MAYLVDTNILARLANSADPQRLLASSAVLELHRRKEVLHLTPQVLIEFRGMATRPIAQNGLGLSASEAETQAAGFEAAFPLLADAADIFPTWKAIVVALGTLGKQVHDARLIAVCHVHAITHLLTFNSSHFARMEAYGPGVIVIDPATV